MSELYWITRLDGLVAFFLILTVAFLFCGVGIATNAWEDKKKMPKSVLKLFAGAVICFFLLVLTPSTKTAFVIYGVGGTIDYIKQNETLQGLPDKTIKCLDKFLEEYIQPKENSTQSE